MVYTLKVYTLITVSVFGVAGAVMLALAAWNEARQYAHARRAMRRIARETRREQLAISRIDSRNQASRALRVA